MSHHRRHAVWVPVLALPLLATCGGAGPVRRPPLPAGLTSWALDDLRGEWHWQHRDVNNDASWIERERWQFLDARATTGSHPLELRGRYVRDVIFQSVDGRPFACNQTTTYRQRASFDLRATVVDGVVTIRETSYRAEPSPCDHGFRQLASYQADLGAVTATLRLPGGVQTLLRAGPAPHELPTLTWPGDEPTFDGAWSWTADVGEAARRHERESWVLAHDVDGGLIGTLTRDIDVQAPDGMPLACAGGPGWQLHEVVTLAGQAVEDRYLLREIDVVQAVTPVTATCQGDSGQRVLDSAYAELVGDAVVLEWRGKRRQVLLHPAP